MYALSSTVDSFHGTIDTLLPTVKWAITPLYGRYLYSGGLALHSAGYLSVDLTIMATSKGRVTIDLDHCYSASPASTHRWHRLRIRAGQHTSHQSKP